MVVFQEIRYYWYEQSFNWISCEEALYRNNGHGAPRTTKEVNNWNNCVFLGVTRW